MLNRRQLRIKAMEIIYSYENSNDKKVENQLALFKKSTESFYHLYVLMISFFTEFKDYCDDRLETSKKKFLEDKSFYFYLNVSKNTFLNKITSNSILDEKIKLYNVRYWSEYPDHLKSLVKKIENKGMFNNEKELNLDFESERKQIILIFKKVIASDQKLYDFIEESYLSWPNDFALVNSLILINLKKIKKYSKSILFKSIYKNKKDSNFGKKLIEHNIENDEFIKTEIINVIDNWDVERIAKIDMVLLKMCFSEFLYFKDIPVKVSINEYIDIAKDFSSSKSNVFLNGILDKLAKKFQQKGLINKNKKGNK